ncbi:MAG: hypothetical protein V1724_08415 [Chloroflexota bacterium]
MARGGLVVVYEMAQVLGIPEAVDKELPGPGSGRGYKPSQFVMPMLLMRIGERILEEIIQPGRRRVLVATWDTG